MLAAELRAANHELAAQAQCAHRLRQEAAALRAELQAVRAEDAAEVARLWQRIQNGSGNAEASVK